MLYGNKIEVWVRDLTLANSSADVSYDLRLELPDENLEAKVKLEHEYIIIDSELDLCEFDSIYGINNWLLEADCSTDDLKILCKIYDFKTAMEIIESGDYHIHCFEDETSTWNCGNGVSYTDWWIGYFLHEECGWRFDWERLSEKEERLHGDWFREKIAEMEDYIDYEHLYTQAQTEGLNEVEYNGKSYLVW